MADVSAIISQAQETAATLVSEASEMISGAQNAANGYSTLNTNYGDVVNATIPAPDVFGTAPSTTFKANFDPGEFDEELNLSDLIIPADIVLPEAVGELDVSTLFTVDKPTGLEMEILSAPTINQPTLPTAPAVNVAYYQGGSGSSLTAPSITAPSFDAEFIGTEPEAPTGLQEDFEASFAAMSPQMRAQVEEMADSYIAQYCPQYHTALSAMESKISGFLAGGTALDDTVETQIYGRGQSRLLAERFASERDITTVLSKRGHVIAPGTLLAVSKELAASYAKGISVFAAETAIKRAELEINHLQFCLTLTANVRSSMLQAAIQVQGNMIAIVGQAIDYAKQSGLLAVEIFNAKTRLFQANVDLYRAKADVYRTKLEAAFADLKVFEAQVEAEKLKAEVDKASIDVYQARIAAEELKIRLYLGQLQGVETIARLELNKLEVFKAQVQAQAIQIQIKEIEFKLYQASLEGDQTRVDVYGKQLEAYRTRLEAVKIQMDNEKTRSGIIIEGNDSLIRKFEAGINRYKVQIEAEGQRVGNEKDVYLAALDLYRAEIQADSEGARLALSEAELTLRKNISTAGNRVNLAVSNAEIFNNSNQLRAQIAMAGADAYGQMAGSAMSAVNGIAQQYIDETA